MSEQLTQSQRNRLATEVMGYKHVETPDIEVLNKADPNWKEGLIWYRDEFGDGFGRWKPDQDANQARMVVEKAVGIESDWCFSVYVQSVLSECRPDDIDFELTWDDADRLLKTTPLQQMQAVIKVLDEKEKENE